MPSRPPANLTLSAEARTSVRLGVLLAVAWAMVSTAANADEPAKPDFAAGVRTIFVEHCYKCHGPDKQEAGLRFDLREAAIKGGDSGPWFVPGKSDESLIVRRITGVDDERMPPDDGQAKALSPAEIARIKTWIDAGAAWPDAERPGADHWSFRPIVRPAPPVVKNEAWCRGAIDRFVLAQLEARGIAPSPEADRYTLAKRLSYDLVGLPPDPADADRFAADAAADAYERFVDQLLESPRFGERWGRRWLDLARYADSDGYEKDNARPDAWRYRDWVIDAVNADLPLDRFTIEQLAGDLLPDATPESRLATAFHRQTLTNTEGGADQEQFRVEAIFDRVATTGSVWLGLTIGCAQCHSHKYDPISHEDYYRLFALFNNADEVETEVPLTGMVLGKWQREKEEAQAKLAKTEKKLAARREELVAKVPEWEAELAKATQLPVEFHPVELVSAKSAAGAELRQLSDGSYLVTGKSPEVDKLTIVIKADRPHVTGFRVEALAHDSLGGRGPGRTGHGNFVLSEFHAAAAATAHFEANDRLKISRAYADVAQVGFEPANAIDGKEPTGWAIAPKTGQDHWIVFVADEPLDTAARPFVELVLNQNHGLQHTLGRVRVSAMTGNDPKSGFPEDVRAALAVAANERNEQQGKLVLDYFVSQDAQAKLLADESEKLKARVTARPVMRSRVLAQRSESPRASHVLDRGDFLRPLGEVRPGTPGVLPALDCGARDANRLDFARWLVSPANPLTRRVMANQLWAGLFGRGLVRTPGDFGLRGERPTHPELLDYLAEELIELGWSRKAMLREIVLSATYRQSSRLRSELAETDPLNELFHRQNRYRVEAEIVRDVALAAAGLLVDSIGGPSVFPPLPADIAELSYANNFKWTNSTGPDRYRRGMYTFFKRTAPHPNLTTFDSPDSNTSCLARQTSNTPLQALTTLNNEVFAEAAQVFARRVLSEPGDDRARLVRALRLCVIRNPAESDVSTFSELLSAARAWYASHAEDAKAAIGSYAVPDVAPAENAAWVATGRIMLNLDEFLTRE
jgi:mono/diheme cytochrome c family protein